MIFPFASTKWMRIARFTVKVQDNLDRPIRRCLDSELPRIYSIQAIDTDGESMNPARRDGLFSRLAVF